MPDVTRPDPHPPTEELGYLDVAAARALIDTGELTSADLTEALLRRIEAVDRSGPRIGAVIAVADDALVAARRCDEERRSGSHLGALHGIPVLIKDNLDTTGGLPTTCGSLALSAPACQPSVDAEAVTQLRRAGAIVLGKANLSEWANFRSTHSSSGWSAVGGQCLNPHVLTRSAGGSSSGSGASIAAGLVALAVGTETDGSILCPATVNGVVGIKPTLGLVSTAGVVPISASQDCVGALARSVASAAALLEVLAAPARPAGAPAGGDRPWFSVGEDVRRGALDGARIGVARLGCFGSSTWADAAVEDVVGQMERAGAVIVDPADIETIEELGKSEDELTVLLYEFREGIESYLTGRPGGSADCPRTLADLIAFNNANRDRELPIFGQELFEKAAESGGADTGAYREALARCRRLVREQGLDATFERHRLDALVAPTMGPAWCIDHVNGDAHGGACYSTSAVAGYPSISVPIGAAHGLPLGMCLMGTAWSEAKLIGLALGVEALVGPAPRPGWLDQPTL